MELLAFVSDIDNALCTLFVYTVAQGRHVSRIVVETSIRFLNHQGHFLFGNKHTHGTLVLNSDATGRQLVDQGSKHWVIERLANL